MAAHNKGAGKNSNFSSQSLFGSERPRFEGMLNMKLRSVTLNTLDFADAEPKPDNRKTRKRFVILDVGGDRDAAPQLFIIGRSPEFFISCARRNSIHKFVCLFVCLSVRHTFSNSSNYTLSTGIFYSTSVQ